MVSFAVEPPTTPLVLACPHAGRIYPPSLLAAAALDRAALRGCEDAYVDALLEGAFSAGFAGVVCQLARVFVDVNRDPWELDPAMFSEALPAQAHAGSPRVAAGLGVAPRQVGQGREIYRRKLTLDEIAARLALVHAPYHAALAERAAAAKARFGLAIVIDWHSMPSSATRSEASRGRPRPNVVLGDRHGGACGRALTRAAARAFERLGYVVALNSPYAGGYTTQTWGRPTEGFHALQIELDRGLYLDESTMEPSVGLPRLKADLEQVIAELAARDWGRALGA